MSDPWLGSLGVTTPVQTKIAEVFECDPSRMGKYKVVESRIAAKTRSAP
jgi:hypothetical protein